MSKTKILLALSILILSSLACNALIPQSQQPQPDTNIDIPQLQQPPPNRDLPSSEESVTRVTLEDTKAAFDNGSAIIVDVRSAAAYSNGHIPGAINIQLGVFETDPTQLDLQKDQWIITYCT